jgi:dUTP pyrophosphatase
MKIKIKKLHPNATIPKYAKAGDAGLDLVITTIKDEPYQVTYGFGIAIEIPEGYVGLVFPRSSIKKTDMILSNSVGVIDSGYRGEIMATFKKLAGSVSNKYFVGERAVQLLIIPYPQVEFEEAETLSDSDRGTGGFGSTGN